MSDPLAFPSATPRHEFPLLFSGQAQKEAFVNVALSRCDALLHPTVEGEVAAPPSEPVEGDCWLVAAGATEGFTGHAGKLAFRQQGQWLFASPRDGMRVLDRATGQHVLYLAGWRREAAPPEPSGGAVVDAEARTAIHQLIGALARTGILPAI